MAETFVPMDLRAQREYVKCSGMGVLFKAHEDYWFYNFQNGRYEVRLPDGDVVLTMSAMPLGIHWVKELRARLRRSER